MKDLLSPITEAWAEKKEISAESIEWLISEVWDLRALVLHLQDPSYYHPSRNQDGLV